MLITLLKYFTLVQKNYESGVPLTIIPNENWQRVPTLAVNISELGCRLKNEPLRLMTTYTMIDCNLYFLREKSHFADKAVVSSPCNL